MKQVEVTPDLKVVDLLALAAEEDVILTQQGQAVALLTEVDEDEVYWQAREQDPEFIASLKRAREQIAEGQGLSIEEVRRRLGL